MRFFLGHEGFGESLIFEPHQLWSTDCPEKRIYGDMASADGWWQMQEAIGIPGATVVPLIIASDKTQVTNHQGDLAAHAVYLTIGNLPAHIRNSNDRPGTILLAMLPVVKEEDAALRSKLFHECLRMIFDPVMAYANGEGLQVACADGWTRRCFPVIAAMALDYEEQVKITGVKSNIHCTICTIPPNQREDLEASAPWRTHGSTQRQIMRQRLGNWRRDDAEWVHDIDCFAFGHAHVNIHATLAVDILHQLLKGVLMHALDWTIHLLQDRMSKIPTRRAKAVVNPSTSKSNSRSIVASKQMVANIIDKRFAVVPSYAGMRIFKQLSSVKQWTGKEAKSILRQMVPVFTPLLADVGAMDAIRFIRAMVDFMLLAMYKSHDDETLRYMTLALHRMNSYKEIFRDYRRTKRDLDMSSEGDFNFPKFHAMTHYVDMIRLMGNAADIETGHFEHKHVDYVKNPFKRTNKKNGWEDQVMDHHCRKLNMLAAFDITYSARAATIAEKRERAERPVQPTQAVDVATFFGWPRTSRGNIWRTVEAVEDLMGQPTGGHFRQAIAVFLRESRAIPHSGADPTPSTRNSADTLEKDDSWVMGKRVKFHSSIRCWKPTGQDPDDPDAVQQDIARCCPNWQGIKGNGRYDWIWVQECPSLRTGEKDAGTDSTTMAFDGRLPAYMKFVVTVEDTRELDDSTSYTDMRDCTDPQQYTGVFADIYRPIDKAGAADKVHGMTVVTPIARAPWRGQLRGRKMYTLTSVYHTIHVIPVDENKPQGESDMYINNTADFETYNTLWNPEWESDEARAVWESQKCRQRVERTQQSANSDEGNKRRKRG